MEIILIKNKNLANASWIIGCRIVQALLGIVISMLTARYLGPSNFGVINYAAAVVAFVTPITKLGLTHVLVQEFVYSPESEGKTLGSSLVLSLITSVFCIIGVISFACITNAGETETIIVCALYSLILVANALELVQYWFQAKLISKYTSVVSVIAYLVISIYKIILLITESSVYWFAVSSAIDHLLIGFVLLAIYKKKSAQKLSFSWETAKRLFSKSKFFIVSSMMVTIFAQTDKIMLKLMIDDAATGIYSAASACAAMTSFVFAAIIDSMRPTIVENKKHGSANYELNMRRTYAIIIYLALAQSLSMTLLAKPIIMILYGSEYLSSVSVLSIIVWQATFSYMGSVRNVWILAEEKQRYLWIINLSGALTNVVLNFVLIPKLGVEGAALASVITQIFTNFIIGFIIKPIRKNNALMLKSLDPRLLTEPIKIVLRKKHS